MCLWVYPVLLSEPGIWTCFNPLFRERSDTDAEQNAYNGFQSTLPARGATLFGLHCIHAVLFQSTLPARATASSQSRGETSTFQSTLPARGATFQARKKLWRLRFQSTLPARGATSGSSGRNPAQGYFNPRSPRGERPHHYAGSQGFSYFNPRSPRGERHDGLDAAELQQFQSTLPARGATMPEGYKVLDKMISIHAPREGSDAGR